HLREGAHHALPIDLLDWLRADEHSHGSLVRRSAGSGPGGKVSHFGMVAPMTSATTPAEAQSPAGATVDPRARAQAPPEESQRGRGFGGRRATGRGGGQHRYGAARAAAGDLGAIETMRRPFAPQQGNQ